MFPRKPLATAHVATLARRLQNGPHDGVAVAVLALGFGSTSAIFSRVSAVWLKSLRFADAERNRPSRAPIEPPLRQFDRAVSPANPVLR